MKLKAKKSIAAAGLLTSLGLIAITGATSGQDAPTTTQATTADLAKLPPLTKDAGDGDFMIAPPYTNAPELTPHDDVPKGMVYHFTMQSTDSKLYPGISKTAPGQVVPYQRRVTVYVPSQYVPGTPTPFFVSQDSMGQGHIPTILDNMIADRRLPIMVAVMIDSGGGDAQGSERGLEYDTVSGRYAEFIETEVLPKITQDYHVTFSKNPDARMTMGGSSGGAAAFSMAWYHPEWYHRVLTYSGTYVNQQSPLNTDSPHGAWEYHAHFIPESKRKPLRIWMQVGENDIRSHDPESTYHNWVMANQRMAEVLKAKKYHYQFVFCAGAGHVDGRAVNQTLPQALEYVWKGYPNIAITGDTSAAAVSSQSKQSCKIVPITVAAQFGFAYAMNIWFRAEGNGTVYMKEIASEKDSVRNGEAKNGRFDETPKRRTIVDKVRARLVAAGWTEVGKGDAWYSYTFEKRR